jgi:hypothetical protein
MRKFLVGVLLATCSWLGGTGLCSAQTDFNWNGQLAAGQTVEIKGINGGIHANAAKGGDVLVTAARSARRSNPADVRFEVVPHAGGVTICAIYPSPAGEPANECAPGGRGRTNTRDNDTVVDFTVQVPAGVNFVGRTVNGSVDGDSLPANAEAYTVNGSVNLSAAGTALGNTVNGSISATMGRADWQGGGHFKTVNGDITLRLPVSVNAQVDAETVNGSLRSEFPLTLSGEEFRRKRLNGTIGNGGQTLDLKSVNGSISLLKR